MEITIRQPNDYHVHFRDGDMLQAVVPHTALHFGKAIVMPNLVPPVINADMAIAYRERIMAAVPEGFNFQPLMTLYLTEETNKKDIDAAIESGIIHAVKLYPAGATTNSQSGVTDIKKVYPILEHMADKGLNLCVHGEVTKPEIDIFDREAVFIEEVMEPIRKNIPELKIVMEHITTKNARDYVKASDKNLAATITTHHLMINRNHMLVGGIRPHYYCLPIVKREEHRLALVEAAISGDPKFFLGTDSAPHPTGHKQSACGCAGVFSAMNTMACLAHVFDQENALDKLEGFVSIFGDDYYGLPHNEKTMTLKKRDVPVSFAEAIEVGDETVTVFDPAMEIYWNVESAIV